VAGLDGTALAADRARRGRRARACLVGASFCFAALFLSADWSEGYLTSYGTLLLSTGELAFKLYYLLFILPGTVLLASAAAQFPKMGSRLLEGYDALASRRHHRVWAVVGALLVLLLSYGARVSVLRSAPVTDDENVYLFEAQLIASGRLYAEGLPADVRASFDNQFMVNGDRRFGMYFIGHPVIMALALKLGAIDWVGSVEAALTFLLALGIAARVYGSRTAILTGTLLILSPFFLLISATAMSQTTSGLFLALAWYAALRIEAAPRTVGWWVLLGSGLIVAGFARPQTAAVLALPVLVRLTWLLRGGRLASSWAGPAMLFGVLAAGAATFLWVNHVLTGHALLTSYTAYWQWSGRTWPIPYGLGWSIFAISQNLMQLNFWLFGWPLSLVFVPLFERRGAAWMLAAIPAVGVLGYALLISVPTIASVGPVYYAELVVPLAILSASGLCRTIEWTRARLRDPLANHVLVAWPLALTFAALFVFVPIQLGSLRLMSALASAPYDLVEQHGLQHAVVFVRSLPPLTGISPGAWVYYHRNSSPDLSEPVLFVKDLGPDANRRLLAFLPGRDPYLMGVVDRQLVLTPYTR
jgi:hypothetical protein